MSLKPGAYSAPRPAEEIADIKKAIGDGMPFKQFLVEVMAKWPRFKDLKGVAAFKFGSNTQGLYVYYGYRLRGDARYALADAPDPARYTPRQRLIAQRFMGEGKKFSEFWTAEGSKWGVPMYRLRNWYRTAQKRWRDVVALSPAADQDGKDHEVAVVARATTIQGEGSKTYEVTRKTCERCGSAFEAKYPWMRYCGAVCRMPPKRVLPRATFSVAKAKKPRNIKLDVKVSP